MTAEKDGQPDAAAAQAGDGAETTQADGGAPRRYDVVVIGGGAAGLSGAVALARFRRSVLVIDGGAPRNAPAAHAHNYLTRDGAPPHEILAAGRAEVARYGGEFLDGHVATAEPAPDGGFRVVLADGTEVRAARLLVTTGLVDELPGIPGMAERWGRDVLHCPYCHGWEVRDRAIGVLASGPMSVHQAQMWRQLSEDVTVFAHTAPPFGEEASEELAARGIRVVEGEVTELRVTGDRLSGVVLADGRVVPVDALTVAPYGAARAGFLEGLGLKAVEQEKSGQVMGSCLAVDATGATEVPGVWAAGNVVNVAEQVIGAAAGGFKAASAINGDLIAEETREAVAARRAAGRA